MRAFFDHVVAFLTGDTVAPAAASGHRGSHVGGTHPSGRQHWMCCRHCLCGRCSSWQLPESGPLEACSENVIDCGRSEVAQHIPETRGLRDSIGQKAVWIVHGNPFQCPRCAFERPRLNVSRSVVRAESLRHPQGGRPWAEIQHISASSGWPKFQVGVPAVGA